MNMSIIVPVLNEAALIREFLVELRDRAPKAEIVVVDGTSSDRTTELATGLCDRTLQTAPGRARQMNAGASVAKGDILWFLHADARIPDDAIVDIQCALRDREVIGGFFRIQFPRPDLIYRLSDLLGHYAGLLLGIRYGDHGFFCRREDFFAIGGYPDLPLLEDAEFYRSLRRRGRIRHLSSKIVASARRYEEIGPYRLTAAYLLLSALYLLRVPIPLLKRIYDRLCVRADKLPRWLNKRE